MHLKKLQEIHASLLNEETELMITLKKNQKQLKGVDMLMDFSEPFSRKTGKIGIILPQINTRKSVDQCSNSFNKQSVIEKGLISRSLLKNRGRLKLSTKIEVKSPVKVNATYSKTKMKGDSDELPLKELELIATEILKSINIPISNNVGLVDKLRLIELNFDLSFAQAQIVRKFDPHFYSKAHKELLLSQKMAPNQMKLYLERKEYLSRLQKTMKMFEKRESKALWRKDQKRSFFAERTKNLPQITPNFQNQTYSEFFI